MFCAAGRSSNPAFGVVLVNSISPRDASGTNANDATDRPVDACAMAFCLAHSRKSLFLRQPYEDVGKGTNLRLGRTLRWVNEKVRCTVSYYFSKWRHQGTHIKPFLRHVWVADCNPMTFCCGSERQFKCIEYKPLSSIDVRRPDTIKPTTPFRITRSRM